MTYKTESIQMDRYMGAMLGVAIGDALGAPLEFMSADEIQKKYGEAVREMVGGGWLSVVPGEVTDDTQMTLAVAEGIAAEGDQAIASYRQVGENFLRWYGTHPKDVGGCCAAVLSRMNRQKKGYLLDWHEAAEAHDKASGGSTAGNGALMRTIYPALYYKRAKAQEAAADIAKMTHWHEHSTITVESYTAAINAIVNAPDWVTPEKAKEFAETEMVGVRELAEGRNIRPTGYCVDSLICAMNAVRDTDSLEDALVEAVNLGGDADTIGAITGGLAGAIYGLSAIPQRWIDSLDNEPNHRTIQLFHGEKIKGNALVARMINLAYMAYEHHANA